MFNYNAIIDTIQYHRLNKTHQAIEIWDEHSIIIGSCGSVIAVYVQLQELNRERRASGYFTQLVTRIHVQNAIVLRLLN